MNDSARELVVSVTAADCRFDYYRGSGAGGQHRNKTDSACRCTHEPSGAVGTAQDTRSQHENRRLAFGRMARSERFQKWLKLEVARRTGAELAVKESVERAMQPKNLRVEGKTERGTWSEEAISDD